VTVDWFATQRLREGVYLIAEPMHVNNYLIVGSRRAVLFDTGLGIADIRQCVESITDKPVLVLNSHHHFDHVGGNHRFDDIAFHRNGLDLHRAGPLPHWLPKYLECVAAVAEQYRTFEAIDREWFNVLGPEMRMRSFPADFDPDAWAVTAVEPTRVLDDGDEIDLGDRVLRVLHTPGHTVDSICLLDEQNRLLFSGDTVDTGPIYVHLASADVEAFSDTADRLARDVAPKVDDILCAHGPRYRAYPDILARLADAFESLRSGAVELDASADCFLDPAAEARFDGFSLVVPPGFGCCHSGSAAH
jgi:glyoxylase-like metal-dependent hydrolase (beta-lactamase superfamily II)